MRKELPDVPGSSFLRIWMSIRYIGRLAITLLYNFNPE